MSARESYVLRLYVTGLTPRSSRAITNLRSLCDKYLPGRYDLRVIDLYDRPELAREAQVVAAPTLVKELPPPCRRVIGDMSDAARVLNTLDVRHRL